MSGKRRILDGSWSAGNVCLPTMEVWAQGFEISLAQLVRGLDRERPTTTHKAPRS
jgi:hypothetical protein